VLHEGGDAPVVLEAVLLASRSSSSEIRMPRLRNDSSRSRCERVSKLKLVVSKICPSG